MPNTLTAKILPPAPPVPVVARPRLEVTLARVEGVRLANVVAGAGFGKTTLLAGFAGAVGSAWYTLDAADRAPAVLGRGLTDALRLRLPGLDSEAIRAVETSSGPDVDETSRAEALAGLLCAALDRELVEDLVLILDDVQELGPDAPSARTIEALCRQAPPSLHVVLSSRSAPPFPVQRLRGRGQVLDLDAGALAFTTPEVAELIRRGLGEDAASLAERLHARTEGWPAAVRLAIEVIRPLDPKDRERALERIGRPGDPLFEYLAEEVFAREDPAIRELVQKVAILDGFGPGLCEAVGIGDAEALLGSLVERGVFVEPREGVGPWFALAPMVRDYTLERLPLEPDERAEILRKAGEWLRAHGRPVEALRCLREAGEDRGVRDILVSGGRELLNGGQVEAVISASADLGGELRSPQLEQLEGEARQVRGDWEGALACFRRAAPEGGDLPAGLAWRMGLIHHLRGELELAAEVYSRGRPAGEADPDQALLLAWNASLLWLRGDSEGCRELAEAARAVAAASGDERAIAASHTALAMLAALDGDRRGNDAHYLRALDAAERARDILQIIRIRTNRGSQFTEEGSLDAALRELDIAISLGELTGFTAFLALSLNNRGQVRFLRGSLDEALSDFEASRAVYQRIASRTVSYPLAGMGDVYRERGDLAQARATYEEAVKLAEEADDVQGLVPSLAGLARVIAAEDVAEAERLAKHALGHGPGMGQVAAALAAGWVALQAGDGESGRRLGADAAAWAGSRRDKAGLAEALALQALSSADPAAERAKLEEAREIWRSMGSRLESAKIDLALALLGPEEDPERASAARENLGRLGVRVQSATSAGLLSALQARAGSPVAVQTLGGFRVLRDGHVVPATEWQSRKARDLLKLLIARRGHPVPREVVMEILWPDEEPEKLANRLSVALTTARAVLDPERKHAPDRFVAGDKEAVWIEREALGIDVEDFLAEAARGRRLLREGRAQRGLTSIRSAESVYSGDFLEENAYDDWAVPLREEARAAYLAVARELAGHSVEAGDLDGGVRYFLRVIERDPFDEQAHLGLVSALASAGRHGEADRHYRTYRERMEELDVEPAPFPAPG